MNSYIVLQHIPIRRGMRILRRLVDKVEPGGGLSLHLSVHTRGPAWRAAHWLVHHVPLADRLSAVAKGRPWSEPAMQMNGYPLQAILVHLAEQGIRRRVPVQRAAWRRTDLRPDRSQAGLRARSYRRRRPAPAH